MAGVSSAWIDKFHELGQKHAESAEPKLHQTAGWHDIDDEAVWEDYALDVVQEHRLSPGASVFEAGCGVLAFLAVLKKQRGDLRLWGVDGSESSIELVQSEIAESLGVPPGNFRVGMLPKALHDEPAAKYDLTMCNSVLQYLSKEDGLGAAKQMINMTRPGGTVILADVCDAACMTVAEQHLRSHFDGYGSDLPQYTYFEESDWNQLESLDQVESVHIRRTSVSAYHRRNHRYIVEIELASH
jgi:SAM-dependent methyltransferase